MPFPFRSIATLLLGTLLPSVDMLATTVLADGYAVRVWQTEDGLPQNLVTSAVQTRDGYLWLGTHSGLARFDGERFEVFNSVNTPELVDRRITQLFEDAGGTLWIGHESGALSCYQNGTFTSFAPPVGVENEHIIGLGSDTQGRMWAMRQNGAVDSLDYRQRLPSLILPDHPQVMDWSRSAAGHIWLGENGRVASLVDGKLKEIDFDPAPNDRTAVHLAATGDGGVWILRDGRIRKWKDQRWMEDRGEFPWPQGSLACSLELRDGTLAVGTIYSGLYLVFGDGRPPVQFDRSSGLPQNWIRFLYEDREGNLWAGTGSAGAVSIHPSAFSVLNSPDQWKGCTVVSVAPGRNDTLWIATDGAGVYRYASEKWSHYGESEGIGNLYVQAVTETSDGQVWAGNFWWGGPYRLENGRFVRTPHVDERTSPVLSLLAPPGSDKLLVGTRDGLLELKGNDSTWLIKSPEGSADDVSAIAQDRQGVVWCGFTQGGLARIAGGQVTVFRRKDGLASDAVQCVFADDDGSLWIGTADNGLTRFKDGRFASVGVEHGLADHVICYILDDGLGHFWLSTHHGLQRIAKAELNRCADRLTPTVSSQIYNRDDGLPIVEFTGARQGAGCRTKDGRLWFASSKGVISVDPKRVMPNPTPPPVIAETLLVDGKKIAVDRGVVRSRLAPDHQRLEFHYTGLSFVAPGKVRFRYRLDGLDKDWVEAGSKRTAFYSQLPAGTYRFRVIACNNDGVWNNEGASLTFAVAPFFWQTWWFVGACLLGSGASVAYFARYITRRRVKRQIEQIERQHEVERERARIAQDIHDDVGASLSRIAMLSQPARHELAEPERTAAVLGRIYTTAREVTRALDEIVWAVDPRHDTLDSLVDYMGRFAQDFLATDRLRCRLDLPVEVPAWPLTAETRHNLFLAFKEVLNNIVRHAAATEVRISLTIGPKDFALTVKDNGRGFTATPSSTTPNRISSGHGLVNIKRRLNRIGGRCEIVSERTGGTSVTLVVTMTGLSSPPLSSASSEPIPTSALPD